MQIPIETGEIFERLSKGLMISADSQQARQVHLYRILQQHQQLLTDYFAPLNLELVSGPGYFYLQRPMSKSSLEERIERLSRTLRGVEFMLHYHPSWGPGHSLVLPEILEATSQRQALRRLLRGLPLKGSPANDEERLLTLLRQWERESWVEQVATQPPTFRVLSAADYLLQLLARIEINPALE